MLKKTLLTLIAGLMVCLGSMTPALGQEITGNIVGTVRDSNGAGVPNATVVITDSAQNIVVRTVTTNEDGEFMVPNLAATVYSVSVEAPSFKKSVQTNVKVDVGQRRGVDIVLEAGRIEEIVTVEADTVAVDLTSPTSATLINGDQVREISINNRNFVQLVALAPGVTNDLEDLVFTGTNNPETQVVNRTLISVNGARATQNTFTVDGADVTDRGSNLTIQAYPSVDSIGEFRVLRSLYPAESGASGGGQVNVITRSGGNKFHGTFFEFVRNEAFNANSVAINSNPNPPLGRDENGKAKRRPFRYHNYGWTVGGPIYFLNFGEAGPDDPWFGKQPGAYFFYSQEFRYDSRYPTLVSTVPDANMKRGIFPIPICIRGTIVGTTRTCLQELPAGTALNTLVPLSRVAQDYVRDIWNNVPNPSTPATLRLDYPTLNLAKFKQEVIKIDKTFNSKVSASYRFQNDKIPTEDADGSIGTRSGIPFVNTMNSNSPGRTHTAQVTWVAKPNLIVEGRYVRGFGGIFTETTGLIAKSVSNITAPLPYISTRDVVPVLSVAGFNSLTGFSNYDNFSYKQAIGGNVTWIVGSHTTKFGANRSNYRKNENAITGTNQGQFSAFNNTPLTGTQGSVLATGVPNDNISNAYQSWANFLQGNNASFTQSKLDMLADLRQWNVEAYAQDEWRFRSNLTLYFGVRYSYFGAPMDANGLLTNFDPLRWDPAQAPQVTGAANRLTGGNSNFCNGMLINAQNYQTGPPSYNCRPIASPYGDKVYKAPTMNFAPRVGLAWDPFRKGETAIRMGYGIYHDQFSLNPGLLIVGFNAPFQETCTISATSLDQPVPGNNCTAQASALVSTVRGIEPEMKQPYLQHWSLDVQQTLTKKTIVTLGYYGSRGVHLIGFTEYNNLAPGRATQIQCAIGAGTLQNPTAGTQLCLTPGTAYTATPTILDQVRPFRGYRSINMSEARYNSDYHSLQASAQHRFSGASQLNFAYTWSKNLTDNPTSYINAAPQNPFDGASERGLAPLDRRHVVTGSFIYELPFYQDQKGFVGKLLGGWQVSGIASYQTGTPYTITSATYDPSGIGFIPSAVAGGRPQLLCDPNVGGAQTVAQWFNTACFAAQNATGIQNVAGSAGRGIILGPPTKKLDTTVSKNIKFNESMRLQLRAEAFNVLNLQNWRLAGTPNLSRTALTFGQITSFRDARVMQFAVKFYW